MPLPNDPNLRLEKWASTDNRHECHYFLADCGPAAYQDGHYVFGYNPSLIGPDKVARILDIIKEKD
jgi:hypothetical protein